MSAMNRRSLLGAILGLPMMSTGALAALPRKSEWNVVINKIGLPVHYSNALAADLWSIHGIHCESVMKYVCGTELQIVKDPVVPGKNRFYYTLSTNDKRDGKIRWSSLSNPENRTRYIVSNIKLNHKWQPILNAPFKKADPTRKVMAVRL